MWSRMLELLLMIGVVLKVIVSLCVKPIIIYFGSAYAFVDGLSQHVTTCFISCSFMKPTWLRSILLMQLHNTNPDDHFRYGFMQMWVCGMRMSIRMQNWCSGRWLCNRTGQKGRVAFDSHIVLNPNWSLEFVDAIFQFRLLAATKKEDWEGGESVFIGSSYLTTKIDSANCNNKIDKQVKSTT